MAFDPTLPLDAANVRAHVLRDQFNGLKALIDAIPAGPPGPEGPPGPQGPSGSDGPPGPVTEDELNTAIATTSANSNSVGLWNGTVSDPPTQAEVQAIGDTLNALITALRRS